VLEDIIYNPAQGILDDLGVTPLCGNYSDFSADSAPDTSAWMRVRDPAFSLDDETQYPDMIETNMVPRFTWGGYQQNARLINYGDLGHFYSWSSIEPAANFVDNAQMYQVETTTHFNHIQNMENLYLPTHPAENAFDAQFRVNRHRLEAAINCFDGGRQHKVEPYLPFPGETFQGVTFNRDMILDLLAMIRAKDIRQINPWRGDDYLNAPPNGSQWTAAKQIYQQAYAFKVYTWAWNAGQNTDYTVNALGDITNTLRAPPESDYGIETVLVADSEYFESDYSYTEAYTQFTQWETAAPGMGLKIVFENSVEISGGDPVADPANFPVYGQVFIWDFADTSHSGGWWRALNFYDVTGDDTLYAFGTSDLSTRRTIEISDATDLMAFGKVKLLFRHIALDAVLPNGTFKSKHNLIQVLRTDGIGEEEGPGDDERAYGRGEGQPDTLGSSTSGADINHNGTIDAADLARFAAAYENESSLADYNCDDAITSQDVTDFMADYNQGW